MLKKNYFAILLDLPVITYFFGKGFLFAKGFVTEGLDFSKTEQELTKPARVMQSSESTKRRIILFI